MSGFGFADDSGTNSAPPYSSAGGAPSSPSTGCSIVSSLSPPSTISSSAIVLSDLLLPAHEDRVRDVVRHVRIVLLQHHLARGPALVRTVDRDRRDELRAAID